MVGQLIRRRGLGLPEAQGNFWWMPVGSRAGELAVALEQRGVVVRPFPAGIRVTVGLPAENDAFLVALDAVLTDAPDFADGWTLPTGDRARRTADLLDEIRVAAVGADDERARSLDRIGARLAELGDDDWDMLDTGGGDAGAGDSGADVRLDELVRFLAGRPAPGGVPVNP